MSYLERGQAMWIELLLIVLIAAPLVWAYRKSVLNARADPEDERE